MSPRQKLLATALLLGAAAPFAGAPVAGARTGLDVAALGRMVEREEDHISAIQLGEWLRTGRPDLRVLDVRSQASYDSAHIPQAVHVALDSLAAAGLRPAETIVLYSDAGAHAAQAWVFLQALGYRRVFFLRGGFYEWMEAVMSPALAVDASDRERAAFEKAASLSRYFGGHPRRNVPRSEIMITLERIRRRSC